MKIDGRTAECASIAKKVRRKCSVGVICHDNSQKAIYCEKEYEFELKDGPKVLQKEKYAKNSGKSALWVAVKS